MRHNAILVTTHNRELTETAHQKAREIFDATLISPVQKSVANKRHSFAVFPDGSKEGWEDSDRGDVQRALFVTWLDAQRYEDNSTSFDWVEVQYGDDDGETKIINDSDARRRQESC